MYRRTYAGVILAVFSLFILVAACSDADPVSPTGTLSADGAAAGITDNQTTNSGDQSTSFGFKTTASGKYATAMGHKTLASGKYATAMGNQSTASGNSSFASGDLSVASGAASTALGHEVVASGINSTAVGADTRASGRHTTAAGSGSKASGDYSTALGRKADTNNKEGAFVYADASAGDELLAERNNQFLVRAIGGVKFYSNVGESVGVELEPNGSGWLSVSDVAMKENFRALDAETVLSKVAAMDIREWNYITQDQTVRHVGPTAQDFHAAFGLGQNEKRINSIDVDGIALVAIQGLERRNAELRAELDALQQRLQALERANR